MNLRRNLLIVLGAASLTPRDVFAQGKKPPVVIGWLSPQTREAAERSRNIFRNEFAALGWKEESNYVVEERYADRYADRLPRLAEEIAAKNPALIIAISALSQLAKAGIQALIVMPSPALLTADRQRTLNFALSQRWPVISVRSWADYGALLGYSAESSGNYRRAAYYAARILKGAKPADLPIERPMTFELVLNMKTAKALGLTIPHEFGVRVDRVIQ